MKQIIEKLAQWLSRDEKETELLGSKKDVYLKLGGLFLGFVVIAIVFFPYVYKQIKSTNNLSPEIIIPLSDWKILLEDSPKIAKKESKDKISALRIQIIQSYGIHQIQELTKITGSKFELGKAKLFGSEQWFPETHYLRLIKIDIITYSFVILMENIEFGLMVMKFYTIKIRERRMSIFL